MYIYIYSTIIVHFFANSNCGFSTRGTIHIRFRYIGVYDSSHTPDAIQYMLNSMLQLNSSQVGTTSVITSTLLLFVYY